MSVSYINTTPACVITFNHAIYSNNYRCQCVNVVSNVCLCQCFIDSNHFEVNSILQNQFKIKFCQENSKIKFFSYPLKTVTTKIQLLQRIRKWSITVRNCWKELNNLGFTKLGKKNENQLNVKRTLAWNWWRE